MALKAKYAKKEDIPAGLEDHYKEGSDGGWVLDLTEGDDDATAMRRAKQREKEARRRAEAEAAKLRDQLEELTDRIADLEGNSGGNGGTDDTPSSEVAKLQRQLAKAEAALEKTKAESNKTKLKTAVSELISSITKDDDVASVIRPHVTSRMALSDHGEVIVLDEDGVPTLNDPADLKNDLLQNKVLSAILSKRNSGQAPVDDDQKQQSRQKRTNTDDDAGKLDYAKATPAEIAESIKKRKEAGGSDQ